MPSELFLAWNSTAACVARWRAWRTVQPYSQRGSSSSQMAASGKLLPIPLPRTTRKKQTPSAQIHSSSNPELESEDETVPGPQKRGKPPGRWWAKETSRFRTPPPTHLRPGTDPAESLPMHGFYTGTTEAEGVRQLPHLRGSPGRRPVLALPPGCGCD